jgi:hypothetical protein
LSDEKWNKQLLGGIEADEKSGELDKNDEKKKLFKDISAYTKGPYDKDEGYTELEKACEKIEKEDFKGKKANRFVQAHLPLAPPCLLVFSISPSSRDLLRLSLFEGSTT